MALAVGTPRDERTGNHHAAMRDVTPRSPKKPPITIVKTINPRYVNSGEAVNAAVPRGVGAAVGKPRDEQSHHHGHHARRTHRATRSTTMRAVVYRVTNRLYDNRK